MPDREHIQLWVDALRSGDYRQGQAALKRNDEFCCLGVACDVSGVGTWEDMRSGVGMFFYRTPGEGRLGSSATLPAAVSEWFGFDTDNPRLGNHMATLLNDVYKQSFAEIADRIEETYLTAEVAA